MLRTFRNRVKKMEDYMGRDKGAIIVVVEPWETKEQALAAHLKQNPQDRDYPGVIFIKRVIGSKPLGGLL